MLKVAIVGTGQVAWDSARDLEKLRGCQIDSCCDVNLSKARLFAKEFSVPKIFSSLEDLFLRGSVDAIINTTPDHMHYDVNRMALEQGVHILSEKPLANTYKETRKLLQIAEGQDTIQMLHFDKRHDGPLLKARQLIQEGKLGRILHVEASYLQSWLTSECGGDWKEDDSLFWKLSGEYSSNGVINSIGIDLLDAVTFLAGEVKRAQCFSRSFHKGVHGNKLKGIKLDSTDSAVLMAELKNDALATLHISRVATGESDNLFIAIYGDLGGLKLRVLDDDDYSLQICKGNDRHTAQWKDVSIPSSQCSAHNFIQAIKNNQLPEMAPTFEYAAQLQRLIEKSQLTE